MVWHDIRDPEDKLLDELAVRYKLHPLHVEDCRHRNQNAKIEFQGGYLFAVLKPVELTADVTLQASDLDVFVGRDFIITVQESDCPGVDVILNNLHAIEQRLTPPEFLYRVFDAIVDLYAPVTDRISDHIDALEENALQCPQPTTIEKIFGVRRTLIELRRILSNSRDVAAHLLRSEHPLMTRDLHPFFRDVYDHIARNLDLIEVQRDLVTGATELYLSSVANQSNQVMKVLTVFGTVATPAIIITGLYGMNLEHLPFANHPHSWGIVSSIILSVSGLMLLLFRYMRWL